METGQLDNQKNTEGLAVSRRIPVVITVAGSILAILGLLAVVLFGLNVMQGIRGLVAAEGLWSKNEKEGAIYLKYYLTSGDVFYYDKFEHQIGIIEGIRLSRLELEKDTPDWSLAARGFRNLGLKTEDVDPVMKTYRRFYKIEIVAKAVDIWVHGDELIGQVKKIGSEMYSIRSTGQDDSKLASLDQKLLQISGGKLRDLEDQFAAQISEVAFWAQGVITAACIALSVLIAIIIAGLGLLGIRMIARAETSSRKLEKENWFSVSRARLSAAMGASNGEEGSLSHVIIQTVCELLKVEVGALFTNNTLSGCRFSAGYSFEKPSDEMVVTPGEGVVGQVAQQLKTIRLTELPRDFLRVRTGLGEAPPVEVLLYPITRNNELLAILELASLRPIGQDMEKFLDLVGEDMATAIVADQMYQFSQQLLKESKANELALQELNEELAAQQEELRQSNEELSAQARQLEKSQEQLEESNAELEEERERVSFQNRELEAAKGVLEQKARELGMASKYKSEFLANMSHELRTPLNSIIVLSELLEKNKEGTLSDKQVEYAHTVSESGNQLLVLINEILDLSKIEAGRLELISEDTEVLAVLERIGRQFQPVAAEKGVQLKIQQMPGAPTMIHIDSQRLAQVVSNLVSNAVKFTSEGSIQVIARVPSPGEISQAGLKEESTGWLAVEVADSGIGIPRNKQSQIFDAFQQADGSTERKYGGTGLGLTICKKLLKQFGGDVLLHSDTSSGSRFVIIVPTKCTPETATSRLSQLQMLPHSEEELPAPTNSDSEVSVISVDDDRDVIAPTDRILLIIEDDEVFAQMLADLGRERDFRCLIAGDCRTGIALANKYIPTAILLDLTLPELDGMAAMSQLKDNLSTRHIPIHIISGREQLLHTLRAGAIGYLKKPVNMGQLDRVFGRVQELVSRRVRRLLIVESDKKDGQALADMLHGEDMEITVVQDGMSALPLVRSQRVDCVLLGEMLDDMSGADLLNKIRRGDSHSDTPVIALTHGDESVEARSLLHRYADRVIDRTRISESLLDETSLFLHRVEKDLPESQRRALRAIHDRDAILRERKVLLVDDDIRNVFALSSILEEQEMKVVIARHGGEVLPSLEANPDVAIVLMDIMMPGVDGYEATRRIRAESQFAKLPVIALTAKAMREDRGKCIEAGANDYLAKPVVADTLFSMMRVWLYSVESRRDNAREW